VRRLLALMLVCCVWMGVVSAEDAPQALLTLTHNDVVTDAAWSPDEGLIATASEDGLLRVWDASDGAELRSFAYPDAVRGLTWSVDGLRVLAWSADGTVRVWAATEDGTTPLLDILHPGGIRGARWNADESQILTWGGADGLARVWSTVDGQIVERQRGTFTDVYTGRDGHGLGRP